MKYTTLANGVRMPMLGIGLFRAADGEEAYRTIRWAVDAGYRLIDTARDYGNESSVGSAVRECGVTREELFVTTKLSNADNHAGRVTRAFHDTLRNMGLDYLDLYLLHWPVPGYQRAWEEMERLYEQGLVRAIGVCNCHANHLEELGSGSAPMLNQVELHPFFPQKALRGYCANRGIRCEAWSPLGGDGAALLRQQVIVEIAQKHGKTPAQVVLAWDIRQGVITIPKSVHKERIESNIQVFDFSLDEEDMMRIGALSCGRRYGPHPDDIAREFEDLHTGRTGR